MVILSVVCKQNGDESIFEMSFSESSPSGENASVVSIPSSNPMFADVITVWEMFKDSETDSDTVVRTVIEASNLAANHFFHTAERMEEDEEKKVELTFDDLFGGSGVKATESASDDCTDCMETNKYCWCDDSILDSLLMKDPFDYENDHDDDASGFQFEDCIDYDPFEYDYDMKFSEYDSPETLVNDVLSEVVSGAIIKFSYCTLDGRVNDYEIIVDRIDEFHVSGEKISNGEYRSFLKPSMYDVEIISEEECLTDDQILLKDFVKIGDIVLIDFNDGSRAELEVLKVTDNRLSGVLTNGEGYRSYDNDSITVVVRMNESEEVKNMNDDYKFPVEADMTEEEEFIYRYGVGSDPWADQ